MPPMLPKGQKLHPVTITFSSPGTQPPVYISGEITETPWEPQVMNVEDTAENGPRFMSSFHLPPGSYQYKFRLGGGDWWLCDSSAATVTTQEGIVNNLLIVPETSSQSLSKFDGSTDTSEGYVTAPEMAAVMMAPIRSGSDAHTPGFPADSVRAPGGTTVTPTSKEGGPMRVDMKSSNQQFRALKERFEERGDDPYAGVGDGEDTPLSESGAPLLPHEIGALPPTPPDDKNTGHLELLPVPDFPVAESDRRPSSSSRKSRSNSRVPLAPTPEDLHDPNVEHFPADRQNILKRIQTLKHQLPEDETKDLEAIEYSDGVSSEEGSDQDLELLKETRSEPISPQRPDESSNTVKIGADIMASSHEHLDVVPEYEEPTVLKTEESHAESAGAGIHKQSENDAHFDGSTSVSSDQSKVPNVDGAVHEQSSEEIIRRRAAGDHKSLEHGADEAEWTADESDDVSSEATLVVNKQDGFFLRLWSQMQGKLFAFWQFISGGFPKAKSD